MGPEEKRSATVDILASEAYRLYSRIGRLWMALYERRRLSSTSDRNGGKISVADDKEKTQSSATSYREELRLASIADRAWVRVQRRERLRYLTRAEIIQRLL
jgi:hypothetical protein